MRSLSLIVFAALLAAACGCGERVELAPASGRVLYNDKPLAFGSVMFQPPAGQPARATIQSDGTFALSTFEPGDGATVGPNRVRVTCFDAQNPDATPEDPRGEGTLGRSLIPREYAHYDTSGLSLDVPPEGKSDVELRLTGPGFPVEQP